MQDLSAFQTPSFIAIANTMGHSILIETFKSAAYYLNHSNGLSAGTKYSYYNMKESQSCYLFIQGTGLDILIHRFGMSYDADSLRDTFNYCVRKSA